MHKKITIIGSGFVGSTTAFQIASKNLADIVLIDKTEGIAKAKALDIAHSLPFFKFDIKIKGSNNFSEMENSDIVVITAGIPRKPGMSRDDLLIKNSEIIREVCNEIKKYANKSIVIVVTNPLDSMSYKAWKILGFDKKKVIGMAGMLDSARMKMYISQYTGHSLQDINAMVIGSHGNEMVPLTRFSSINGIPIKSFLDKESIKIIIEKTKNAGAEIVSLLKEGSAYFAPANAIAEMIESIILDKKRIMPCTVYCSGEYGANGIFLGVPVILGSKGAEKIIEIQLDKNEKILLEKAIGHNKNLVAKL